jgi:hypothetical protein
MKKLGIIQPGKIGDIIICLPIAKWYSDRGYKVVWPIDNSIINNFIGYVDYVEFLPATFDCNLARQLCHNEHCNTIIDLSFTIPNANIFNTNNYLNQNSVDAVEFDQYKYRIANVPFEEKWNLQLNRNKDRESELVKRVVYQKDYVVVQWNGSDCRREASFDNPNNYQILEISPLTNSVFDWIYILENAKFLVLIDSSVANLVEQLGLKNKKYLLTRQNAKPTLKEDWTIL